MNAILGYTFKNPTLLDEALVTPSCKMDTPGIADNQRLEFLGDAVLGLLAADRLYAELPDSPEGALTVSRVQMISTVALCAAAARHGLVPLLKRNRGAAPLAANAKTIADAVEAILGAAWLDGGLAAARTVFDALGLSPENTTQDNPKGDLQIRAQAMKPPRRPVYELLSTAGKSHDPVFTVRVAVEGLGTAVASAHSHKEAEMLAARILLQQH